VTGAVGIAGVTGTFLTGRSARITAVQQADRQRDHAVQERSRTERREAYTAFLEAVNNAAISNIDIKRKRRAGESKFFDTVQTVHAELSVRRSSLRLVAPQVVRKAARDVHHHLLATLRGSARGEDASINIGYESALLALMKADLGYDLAPDDIEAIDQWKSMAPATEDAGALPESAIAQPND